MKAKLIKLFVATTAIFGMAGCDTTTSTSALTSTSTSAEASDVTSEVTLADWVDYASQIKLDHDYKSRDFFSEGIGQVTLKTAIDGDTAHFYPDITTTSDDVIKARFYGIDTPESTAAVEEYGKAASNFTKEKLEEADSNGTIVISSPFSDYGAPEKDSTGSRYLSLVWVNLDTPNCDYTDLTLLNLMIVQEGLSYAKNVAAIPAYSDTFYAAEAQAKAYTLNMFSGEPDPLYNYGDYVTTSLLDLKKEIEKDIEAANNGTEYTNLYNNVKVRVTGTVAGYTDNVLYLQTYFSTENGGRNGGEYAGINIYTGMTAIPSAYYEQNAYVEISGLALDSETFGFQITDTSFRRIPKEDNDAVVLIDPEDNTDEQQLTTLEYAPDELIDGELSCLNCRVSITGPVTVDDFYINDDGDITLGLKDLPYGVYIPFLYYGDKENNSNDVWNEKADFMGKSFTLTGIYTYHIQTSGKVVYQINPVENVDFAVVTE